MVSSNPSLRSLGSILLVLAVGSLTIAAPTSSSTLDVRSQELSDLIGAPIDNFHFKRTIADADVVARSPVRTSTGYETYAAFMKASDQYHAITENEYNVAMHAAQILWTVQFQAWITAVKGNQNIPKQDMAQASAQAQKACPLFQAAQQGAQKVCDARTAALAQYGSQLSQQDQMKAKSYQNHEDQAAGWQTSANTWAQRYTDCQKLRKATMKQLG